MNEKHFASFHLAGFTYCDGIDVFQELKIGTYLKMQAEPDNKFDPYAVALYYNETKIGFIPTGENQQISQFLNLGHTDLFEARINRISPEAHTEKQIGVVVRVNEKEKIE